MPLLHEDSPLPAEFFGFFFLFNHIQRVYVWGSNNFFICDFIVCAIVSVDLELGREEVPLQFSGGHVHDSISLPLKLVSKNPFSAHKAFYD